MMNDIKIFKTNVDCPKDASYIMRCLQELVFGCQFNFDLQDCDRILRIEGKRISSRKVVESLKKLGYQCAELF